MPASDLLPTYAANAPHDLELGCRGPYRSKTVMAIKMIEKTRFPAGAMYSASQDLRAHDGVASNTSTSCVALPTIQNVGTFLGGVYRGPLPINKRCLASEAADRKSTRLNSSH